MVEKKLLIVGVLLLVFWGVSWAQPGDENRTVPKEFANTEEILRFFNYSVQFQPSIEPKKINFPKTVLEESNSDGWDYIRIDGNLYVARIVSTTFIKENVGPIDDVKQIETVAAGEKKTTKVSTTSCSTFKFTPSISYLKDIVKKLSLAFGIEFDQQECKTIEKDTEYSFPPQCTGHNAACYYLGTTHDLYKLTLEIAPCSLGDPSALQDCLRSCINKKDGTDCEWSCYAQFGPHPDFSKKSIYTTDILKPAAIEWSVCTDGPDGPASILTMTAPNGGESLPAGSTQTITWAQTDASGNVTIDLYKGDVFQYTLGTVSTDAGSFSWTIPTDQVSGSDYSVRISQDEVISDSSDSFFTITCPIQLTITSPNGRESWLAGTQHNITWTSIGQTQNVKLEYSLDSGTTWNLITESAPNNGLYSWQVPDVQSFQCLVRVSDMSNTVVSDTSNDMFYISRFFVTAPVGSDWIESNSRVPTTIRWIYAPNLLAGSKLTISLLNDAGQWVSTIAQNVAVEGQSFGWWVPTSLGDGWYSIMIVVNNGRTVAYSDKIYIHFRLDITAPGCGAWAQNNAWFTIIWNFSPTLAGKTLTINILDDYGNYKTTLARNVHVEDGRSTNWLWIQDLYSGCGWYSVEIVINDGKNPAYSCKFHICQ